MHTLFPTHGIGGAQDLPIPAGYAITGSGIALAASFVILVLAWRRPRLDAGKGCRLPPRLATALDARWATGAARAVGMLAFGYFVWALIAGPDLASNPVFGVVYVLVWVGLVPVSLLFGPVWKAISPLRTIYAGIATLGGPSLRGGLLPLPRFVGYWPATVGLFAFAWLELVAPNSTYITPIQGWFTAYVVILVLGAIVFGERWFERADPFEAYSTLIAHLSPLGRDADGNRIWQWPLHHLDGLDAAPSRVAVVAVLLGSTAYDSFSRSPTWARITQTTVIDATLLGTLVLLAFCVFVGVTFAAGTMATAVGPGMRRAELPALFAHSVAPIIVGYVVAHYMTLLLEYGQQVLIQLSDPMVNGSNLLGTADWTPVYFLSNQPTTVAVIKVLAVVTGHVLGVIAAHDRAVKLLPRTHQVTGQLGLLAVMVTYTVGGLYLLFSG